MSFKTQVEMKQSDYYNERLKDIIINTCNTIGCDNCGLSWGKDCSATELDSKYRDALEQERLEMMGSK